MPIHAIMTTILCIIIYVLFNARIITNNSLTRSHELNPVLLPVYNKISCFIVHAINIENSIVTGSDLLMVYDYKTFEYTHTVASNLGKGSIDVRSTSLQRWS